MEEGPLLVSDRTFGLYGLRHGHSYAHLRGFPDNYDDEGAVDRHTTVELVFSLVWRVSCGLNFTPLNLRYANTAERQALQRRIGPIPPLKKVYLLEPDSMESYVIASELVIAEFAIGGGADCPLTTEDPAYSALHPPVKPVVKF
jgi:hypothetical protein